MSELVRVPDIGNGGGEIIELLVRPGDRVETDQSLLTLESGKASMEIPSLRAGVVKSIKVKVGDASREGNEILGLEVEGGEQPAEVKAEAAPIQPEAPRAEAPAPAPNESKPAVPVAASVQDIKVPDIGSAGKVNVIEVMAKAGNTVEADQSSIILESDKASMEIPSPASGVVESASIKVGDEVGTGDLALKLRAEGVTPAAEEQPAAAPAQAATLVAEQKPATAAFVPAKADTPAPVGAPSRDGAKVRAGPAVRMLVRVFGVELSEMKTSGPKGRILKEDVRVFVKEQLQHAESGGVGVTGGAGIPSIPGVDFSRFGEVEEVVMARLMQVGAANLHCSWLNVPRVTQLDQSDITDMGVFRVAQKAAAEKVGVKLTVLSVLLKTCAHLLKELSDFNSSLAPSGKVLIRKKYVYIGFTVGTPDGLLVPVIRDVDWKSLPQLVAEVTELADKARNRKPSADTMQGACFIISSLGHIGGTGLTSIVNAPEMAILGVSKATMQSIWDGKAFQPHPMLPLSLPYDHCVINGAAAARFTKRLGELLADIHILLL